MSCLNILKNPKCHLLIFQSSSNKTMILINRLSLLFVYFTPPVQTHILASSAFIIANRNIWHDAPHPLQPNGKHKKKVNSESIAYNEIKKIMLYIR